MGTLLRKSVLSLLSTARKPIKAKRISLPEIVIKTDWVNENKAEYFTCKIPLGRDSDKVTKLPVLHNRSPSSSSSLSS